MIFLKRNHYVLKKKGGPYMRVKVILECIETGERNYHTTKNKRTQPERLELMKYSPKLRKKTLYKEIR